MSEGVLLCAKRMTILSAAFAGAGRGPDQAGADKGQKSEKTFAHMKLSGLRVAPSCSERNQSGRTNGIAVTSPRTNTASILFHSISETSFCVNTFSKNVQKNTASIRHERMLYFIFI